MGPLTKTKRAAGRLAAANHILSELLGQEEQSLLCLALERFNGGPLDSPETLLTMTKSDIDSLYVDDGDGNKMDIPRSKKSLLTCFLGFNGLGQHYPGRL